MELGAESISGLCRDASAGGRPGRRSGSGAWFRDADSGGSSAAGAPAAGAAFAAVPLPMTATGVPIGTTVPAATSCCSSTPASKASRSIVALSVSISARMSPLATGSPTFLSHLESSPSSIVSDRRGITTSDMAASYFRYALASSVSRTTLVSAAASGIAASSSGFAYGRGTSAAATRRTGASSQSKTPSPIVAEISAPIP